MTQRINAIKQSTHPYSEEIKATVNLIDKITNIILVVLYVLGSIIAIVAAVGLTEWADGGSPLMVSLYIIIIFAFNSLVIWCAKLIITTILKSKMNMLNSAYRTEKLTELLVENQASSHKANSAQ